MKALLQRVSEAGVVVGGEEVSRIGRGVLVFLGVEKGDTDRDLDYVVGKISCLRIFEDENGMMNRSVKDIRGDVMVVSQFTLAANCRKGTRPSFDMAECPDVAIAMYEKSLQRFAEQGLRVAAGRFGAHMKVVLINDGPVTILLDSGRR